MVDSISSFTFSKSQMLSETMSPQSYHKQQSGGFFESDSEVFDLIFKSLTDKKPDVASYLVDNRKDKSYNIKKIDKYQRNILHYLVIFSTFYPLDKLLNKIINDKPCGLKTALNKQDKLGNTPLHYSAMLGYHEITNMLLKNGADKKLKNNDSEYVATEVEVVIDDKRQDNMTDSFNVADVLITEDATTGTVNFTGHINQPSTTSDNVADALKNIVKSFTLRENKGYPLDTDTFKFSRDTQTETNEKAPAERVLSEVKKDLVGKNVYVDEDVNTEEIATNILNRMKSYSKMSRTRVLRQLISRTLLKNRHAHLKQNRSVFLKTNKIKIKKIRVIRQRLRRLISV